MKLYPIAILCSFLFCMYSCAKKCPADEKIGSLDLSSSTLSFLPNEQKVQSLIFKNEEGRQRIFENTNPDWESRSKLGVETLCERGDFLDKTVQIAYYEVEAYHLYYRSDDDSLSIGIDIILSNADNSGNRVDTAFYETVAISMYGQSPTISNGVISILSDDRSNIAHIPSGAYDEKFLFVADTILAGRNIKDAYVTPEGEQRDIYIFYTKEKGIEAFVTDGITWLRE